MCLRPSDRLVDHHADQVEIGLGRYRISGNLLRAHVAGSADVGIRAALMPATRLGDGRARDTEVSKHRAIRKQEDIARLDVAMDDTGEVHTLEPVQQVMTLRLSNSYASELIWGTLFLLVIMFLSRGVLPIAGEKITARRARRVARLTDGDPASGPASPPGLPARLGSDAPPS